MSYELDDFNLIFDININNTDYFSGNTNHPM